MKKKGGGRKKAAGVSAKADGSAGTPKKKTTTSAKQKKNNPPELSDIEESPINQCKAPPEGIVPSLVPHTQRNTVCSTRNVLLQPPAHVYIQPVDCNDTIWATVPYLPHFDNIQPLDHTSPHKYPPASFVAAAACAASPANTLEDDDDEEEEGVNLNRTFNDLVGEDASGLDDLSYSSAEDDEDYKVKMTTWRRQLAKLSTPTATVSAMVDGRPTSFQVGPNYQNMME